jgi:hypothetical protein
MLPATGGGLKIFHTSAQVNRWRRLLDIRTRIQSSEQLRTDKTAVVPAGLFSQSCPLAGTRQQQQQQVIQPHRVFHGLPHTPVTDSCNPAKLRPAESSPTAEERTARGVVAAKQRRPSAIDSRSIAVSGRARNIERIRSAVSQSSSQRISSIDLRPSSIRIAAMIPESFTNDS